MNGAEAKCIVDTEKHIKLVRAYINIAIKDLLDRAQNHDATKLISPEMEVFGANFEALGKTEYGTPEYDALLEKVKPAVDHHYSKNRHHPEHWPEDESEYEEIMEHIATLPEGDPSIKWLTSYANSLKSSINNMTLLDVTEMLADWRAATERNKNGNIRKSLEINAKRYGIGRQLRRLLENTQREYFGKTPGE